jgi:hypothetical protein
VRRNRKEPTSIQTSLESFVAAGVQFNTQP